jgi:hypothetical protein
VNAKAAKEETQKEVKQDFLVAHGFAPLVNGRSSVQLLRPFKAAAGLEPRTRTATTTPATAVQRSAEQKVAHRGAGAFTGLFCRDALAF